MGFVFNMLLFIPNWYFRFRIYMGNLIATINLLKPNNQHAVVFRIDIYFLVHLNLNLLLVINHELAGFYYPITIMVLIQISPRSTSVLTFFNERSLMFCCHDTCIEYCNINIKSII
jgi:hypothetical protein